MRLLYFLWDLLVILAALLVLFLFEVFRTDGDDRPAPWYQ